MLKFSFRQPNFSEKEDPTKYSLDYEKLKSFPPTILTASRNNKMAGGENRNNLT
ncbi:hypothetical protein G9F72_002090 [Clostridium estertheticum]|uniref:hypothetical protein n=1 Tax=Clostridium estertheticum TaxID=238834 RepID=UPI001CD092C9|nr:hypothetical protein [Clostridium estertheticum]MBZ9685144.1 hypothetical protein [Clostridium estertheticum]